MTGFQQGEPKSELGHYFVVGVGASAGGLEALERFFKSIVVGNGLSYVVIQHLSPDFKSMMNELIGRYTNVPVHFVEENMMLKPDNIYLIPPKKEMHLEQGHFKLVDKEPHRGLSLPIDIFFTSLAKELREKAIGVILSGTGSDGSRGIQKIHEAGGLVFAQEKSSAKFDGMPLAALETGVVDQVLFPERIPEYIRLYQANPEQFRREFERLEFDISRLEPTQKIFELFRTRHGIDFSTYKPNTILRRLERRLEMSKFLEINNYYDFLMENDDELSELYNDLLIGVTRFFRDEEAFQILAEKIVPEIIFNKQDEEIRVWVAGCATGEEVYSIAILFHQYAERINISLKIKIFATDVHKMALETAAIGSYAVESLAKVSPDVISRYFVQEKGRYRIIDNIRKMVVFSAHDLTRDPPFSKMDLVTCRNLLIYINSNMQKSIITKFHFSLLPKGVLFLGPSESLGDLEEAFETLDNRWKMYEKHPHVKLPIALSIENKVVGATSPLVDRFLRDPNGKTITRDNVLMRVYDSVLEEFVPAGFLVNDNLDIIHVFSDAHSFMSIPSGRLSYTLTDAITDDLKAVIISSLQKIRKKNEPVRFEGVKVTRHNQVQSFTVSMRLIKSIQDGSQFFLIILEQEEKDTTTDNTILSQQYQPDEISRLRIQSLEAELKFTKENLQATIEELETSNEEVQATNEELVASNEELQSTNEELHSVNEELYSVNSEYQQKISELTQITNDMKNLIASTNIGTIFLDKKLCIRKFTPAIQETFSLIDSDISRPITHFAHNIDTPNLVEDIRQVLDLERTIEREVQNKAGEWYLMRILPYRQKDSHMTSGVVLAFVDIAIIKKGQALILEKQKELESFTATAAHDLRAPLRRISGFAQFITKQIDEGKLEIGKQKLKSITQIAKEGGQLVDDLLSYSKLESAELQCETVYLDDLVAGIVTDMKTELAEVQGKIVAEDLPILSADKTSLYQLFKNIIENAIKYCREDVPPEITVSVCQEGEQYYHFCIADNGTGIPQHLLEDVFVPFRRVSKHKEGSGVGLAICKKVVTKHHGKIWVESKLGSGSIFHFILPRRRSDAPSTQDISEMNLSKPLRILLIENEDADVELFKIHLEATSLDVALQVFMSSTEMLAATEIDADIIFLDYDLKERFTGLDLLKHLRGPNIRYSGPIILASGQIDETLETHFIVEGGDSVLPKADITDKTLVQILRKYGYK